MHYPQLGERCDTGNRYIWEASLPYPHFLLLPSGAHPPLPRLLSLSQPSGDTQSNSSRRERCCPCCPLLFHSPHSQGGQGLFVCNQNDPAFICITSPLCQKENNKIKEQSSAVNTNIKAASSIPGSSNTCSRTPNPGMERQRFWKEVAEKRKVFSEILEA